ARLMSGRVVDEAGKPVAAARVLVVSTEGVLDPDQRSLGEARTGADGSFTVPDAPEGARIVVVRAPDFVPANRIQLEPKPEERISLQRGGVVRGLVTDASGKAAAGVIVTSEDAAAQTDAEGKFRLTGLPAGSLHLQALWKDDFAARNDGVRVRKGEEVEANLKLKPGVAISGTVIEEGSRRPVAGARVSAYAATATRFGRLARRSAERAVRTDARGRFRLPGLAPARYGVEAARDGYLTASIAGINTATPSVPPANLALRKAASISGRVTDEKGQPVAAARVRIMREMGIRRLLLGAASNPAAVLGGQGAQTAADGTFRLRGLEPERNLSLEATKTGYAAARKPGVSLKAGDAIKDVALVVRHGLEARGKVVDAQGQPVAGAEIRAIHREEGAMGGARVQMRLMGVAQDKPDAVTGGDGAYALKGLEEGQYALTVARVGFARKSVPSVDVKGTGENVWLPVTLTAGASIAGVVRDSTGAPVPGAQVFGIDVGGSGGRPQNATSDADGSFRLDGFVAERAILVNVSAQGYATLQKSVTPPAADLAIVLKTAGAVRGRVEDSDTKKPVTDFSISRSGPRGGGGIQIAIGRGGGDQTFQSDDGTFELTDVPPGKWTIRGAAAGYGSADASGVEVGEGETKEGVVLSLKKGGGLSGRVIDPRGSAVANASVTWHTAETGGGPMGAAMARMMGSGGGGGSTTSDADGHFQFDGLPDARVTVTASHPDYLDASRDIDPSKETSADLSLGTGASISGTVVGSDGRSAVPGALVQLNEEGASGGGFGGGFGGGGGDSTRTDGSGSFLFEHLGGGRYRIIASGNTGKSSAKEVVVADGQPLSGVLVQMVSGTFVHGNVSGLASGQLGGVRIMASGTNYSDSTQTDDSGAYSLHDVPSGVIRLQAMTSLLSGRSTTKTVEVPEGGDFQADIAFQGVSRLSGRVTRGDRPLSGLFVNALPDPPRPNAGRSSGQTDDSGSYALEGLDDGNYTVTVNGQGVSYRREFAVSGDTSGDILLPAISVTGTVTESGSGVPLEGVTVQAQTGNETQAFAMKQGVTDSSGHYFIDDVDPGSYQLTARKAEYQMKTQSLTVGSDSAQSDFALSRGTGVGIQANDGLTGLPLRGVSVIAFGAGGSIAFNGTISLDSSGRGDVGSLGPGAYALYVFSNGYSPRSFPSVMVPSATLGVALTPGGSVEVRPTVQVAGRILDSSGSIYLLGPFRLDATVHPAPPVTVWNNFAPGSYQLVVTGSDGEVSYPFTVAEGRTTTLVVK
ncbi:MAG TPA: carboxypeptidase regulatory-like domain-containing protein, partial [Thermoanaerobaculia bacterium]|nr:carboxypeptidase regulatory-like domain-containing protein [Thermoanaerobaculia bacterium]